MRFPRSNNPGQPQNPLARSVRQTGMQPPRPQTAAEDQYGSFRASLLYCPKCKQATPTRERLLLVLPTGNLYEYLCMACGTSTGSKTDKERGDVRLLIP